MPWTLERSPVPIAKSGHAIASCWRKKTMEERRAKGVCFKCGKPGHMSKTCTVKRVAAVAAEVNELDSYIKSFPPIVSKSVSWPNLLPINKPKVFSKIILNSLEIINDLAGYPKTVTEPKSTGVKRAIGTTGDAIVGPAESVVSGSIDMRRAAQPAWIAGREGSVGGAGGQDVKPVWPKQ